MTNDKFDFTDETKIVNGVTLRRIRYLKSFADIGAGDLGGWIEKETNLNVWGDAYVSGDAHVRGNACVWDDARVSGSAQITSQICAAQRSDGYLFIIAPDKNHVLRIMAGCRYFTIEEAREHWTKTRGGTPLGNETFAILDFLERAAAIRKLTEF